jgi:NADPH2:quinone reductase
MRAAWYEKQGSARGRVGRRRNAGPSSWSGRVRIRIKASGINPGDIKKRQNAFGYGMAYPRIIPHSDGAGQVDQVGEGISSEWIGRLVWCYGAQSYRPLGTAAEFTVVPPDHVAALPVNVSPEEGACLGIPGSTAHRAVHVGGDVAGRTVLVQGAGGAVGMCAAALARHAGAHVIGTVRSSSEEPGRGPLAILNDQTLVERVKALAPEGVDHIVEVAFGANIDADVEMLKMGGSIGAYATDNATPKIPFWLMVFKNLRLYCLGSDDFPTEAKVAATRDLNEALQAGWPGCEIGERVPLSDIARAHELVEHPVRQGRVIVTV